jgi:uncharacterized protein (TIGR03382 family)
MSLLTFLTAATLAQPIVRELDLRGEVTAEAQVIAANDAFIWFTAGEATSLRGGGAKVFRWSRDGGDTVDAIAGRDWVAFDLFDDDLLVPLVRVGGRGRGEALFTRDGDFAAHGRRLAQVGNARSVTPSGDHIAWVSEQSTVVSIAPGKVLVLEGASPVRPISTRDGRLAFPGLLDAGPSALIVQADGGLSVDTTGWPVAGVAAGLLYERNGWLRTEAGDVLSSVTATRQQGHGWLVFTAADGGLFVTDGTARGTRALATQRFPLDVTEHFVTFAQLDGGLLVESLTTGDTAEVGEGFVGSALEDRVLHRDRELFGDGGILRRAVHDCDWRRFDERRRELLCAFDGGLWSRATADAPQERLTVLPPRGQPTGTGAMAGGGRAFVPGAPLLTTDPTPVWTDGIVTRRLSGEGTVLGQSRGNVVLQVDGITLVDPVSGRSTPLGLTTSWSALPSLRELFIQRRDGASCVLRRLTGQGSFEDLEPVCLSELVDAPNGILARSESLEWLEWQPDRHRFSPLPVPLGFQLADVSETWAVFGTLQFRVSSDGRFEDQSENLLLHRPTGATETFQPGARVQLSPQGVVSWAAGVVTLRTTAGERFTREATRVLVLSSTSRALWVVTDREVLVSTGGALQVVTNDVKTWANSAAVGGVLFLRRDTELVTLSSTGETRQFSFVEARPSFTTGDVRWFTLDDGVHGFEPWMFDGDSLRLAADLNPGPASSHPHFIGLARGRLIIEAARADGSIGWTSMEFEPLPMDPTLARPEPGCGCTGVSGAEAWLAVLALASRLVRRR